MVDFLNSYIFCHKNGSLIPNTFCCCCEEECENVMPEEHPPYELMESADGDQVRRD